MKLVMYGTCWRNLPHPCPCSFRPQMYTGSRPWSGLSHAQIVMQVGNGEAKLKWPPSTHPDYRALAEACMHREVSVRPKFEDIVPHIQKLQARLKEGAFSSTLEGVWE